MIPFKFLSNFCFHGFKLLRSNAKNYTRIQRTSYSSRFKMVRPSLNIDSYDCVGFDLDNTLCAYKLDALVRMEYSVMAEYLILKGYSEEIIAAPVEAKELDFMQRGLLLDFERGNVIKLNNLGEILKASHGSKSLSDEEIKESYGGTKKCQLTLEFLNDMTIAWETCMIGKFRALLDFFDMPASLAFARAVDDMDRRSMKNYSECGKDVLAALQEMYAREHFQNEQGSFYRYLKQEPDLYINKCSDMVINWLQELNKSKIVFLVTGSNVDCCHFTASHCLGKNWRDLFDIVVCFAKKPGFFKNQRPFFATKDCHEGGEIDRPEMGKVLSQGNWGQLHSLLAKSIGKQNPSCLYFGDNLVEDVYTPAKWDCCDVAAVVEETFIGSDRWGSFVAPDTLWGSVLQTYAKTCIQSLETLATHPLKEGVPFLIEQESELEVTKK